MPDHASALVLLKQFSAAWSDAMARACWQGGIALLLAWLLCCWRPLPSGTRCWLWRLAYLKFLLALCPLRPFDLPLLPAPRTVAPVAVPAADWMLKRNGGNRELQRSEIHRDAAASSPLARVQLSLCCVWLAGSLLVAGGAVRQWGRARGLRAGGRPLTEPQILALCAQAAEQQGVRRCPALLLHPDAGCPQLTGLLQPAIILPDALWRECNLAEQRLILAHELAHIRRRDLLWAWVPLLGRCLFFFFPPVWLAEREWQQSQEMACDEQVLRLASGSRAEYGNILLKIALLPHPELTSGLMTMRIVESYPVVQRRLIAMKHAGTTPRSTLVAAGTLLLAAGVMGLVPWRVCAQTEPQQTKEMAERNASNARLKREEAGPASPSGLDKEVAQRLQLTGQQAKRAQELAQTGATQVWNVLTPEQQQMAAPKRMGLAEMLGALDLTREQAVRVKTLMRNTETQMTRLKTDETLTPEEREAETKRIKGVSEQQWRQILTPQQLVQLKSLLEQRNANNEPTRLTPAQRNAMDTIKRDINAQLTAIQEDATLSERQKKLREEELVARAKERSQQLLTPEQREQVAAREQWEAANREVGPFHLVDLSHITTLTPEQRARIQTIYTEVERRFVATLTASQQQQLQSMLSRRP